jgi:nucleotide-binding universal stress UspA family protein
MYSKILVPLDGSALAERAVKEAAEIARGTGAELILLKVVQVPLSKVPEAGESEEIKSVQEIAAKARIYLDGIASRYAKDSIKIQAVVLEGPAAAAILGYAHDKDVDVIVMSTHGRTGLSKALMGSVAEQVVLTTKRPVMLVKPEKFRTAHHVDEGEVFIGAH